MIPQARDVREEEAVVVEVKLGEISGASEMQLRGNMSREAISRYRLNYLHGVEMPPLLVARLNGGLVLVDGYHRMQALEKLGKETALVRIVEARSAEEAQWLGAQSNLKNGVPFNSAEKREAVKAYLKAGNWKKDRFGHIKSLREMAAEIGCVSYGTVRNMIKEHFPKLYASLGVDKQETWSGSDNGGIKQLTLLEEASWHVQEALKLARTLKMKERKQLQLKLQKALGALGEPSEYEGAPLENLPEAWKPEENPDF